MVKSNVKSSDKMECSNLANYIARDMSYYYDYEYNCMITTLLLAVRTAELLYMVSRNAIILLND